MAAAETKGEVKEVEEHLETLPCKSYVFKVSVHCQGCVRKVKKALQSIDGVYKINIDLRQQKVVVTGNVDSGTLIKTLAKTGRPAELLPEKADAIKKKKKKKKKKKGKSENPESSEESSQSGDDEKESAKGVVHDTEGGNPSNVNVSEGCATGKSSVQFVEPGQDVRQTVTVLDGGENGAANEKSGGGSGRKKKKKKGQQGNNANGGGNQGVTAEHAGAQCHGHGPGPGPVPIIFRLHESPPRPQCPPHFYAPAPPVYIVSYDKEYPTATGSYGAVYYASPQPCSYVYAHQGIRTGMVASVYDSEPYTSKSSCSFELLSDENPNGCSVM